MRRLAELLAECELHLLALREAMERCPQPLTEAHFARRDAELIAALDQFAYRFTKLQDVMSAKVFRQYALEVLHEPVESAPIIDILNLLERYGLLPSVVRWQEIREIRNQITHECQLGRLPETFVPDDAGLTFAFKEGRRVHSRLCARRSDTEGGRQDKSAGMKADRNRLGAAELVVTLRIAFDMVAEMAAVITSLRLPRTA
jgi:hypothetical protein